MAPSNSEPFQIKISAPAQLGARNQRTGQFFGGISGIKSALTDPGRRSGDTILVTPGNYGFLAFSVGTDDGKSVTLRSAVAGQKWILDGLNTQGYRRAIANTVAASTPGGTNVVIQDAHLRNWKSPNATGDTPTNGAAIFWVGTIASGKCSLTVRDCIIENCSGGVFASSQNWDVTIERTQFINCGSTADPNSHAIYLGTSTGTATLRGCSFLWTYTHLTAPQPSWIGIGHMFKSRMQNNVVQANFFDNRLGSCSSPIDCSDKGNWEIDGNIIIEGPYSSLHKTSPGYQQLGNFDTKVISWDDGGTAFAPPHSLRIRQNTIINYGVATENVVRYLAGGWPPDTYEAKDNVIIGRYADVPNQSKYPAALNTFAANDSILLDAAGNDFGLAAPVAGSGKWTPYAFTFPVGYVPRNDMQRGAVPALKPAYGKQSKRPTWVEKLPLNQWYEIPGSNIGTLTWPDYPWSRVAKFTYESGFALRQDGAKVYCHGGGHSREFGNELVEITLNHESPGSTWRTVIAPTPARVVAAWEGLKSPQFYPDGRPVSGHSSYFNQWWGAGRRFVAFGHGVTPSGGNNPFIHFVDVDAAMPSWLPGAFQHYGSSGAYYIDAVWMDQSRDRMCSQGHPNYGVEFRYVDLAGVRPDTTTYVQVWQYHGMPRNLQTEWICGFHDTRRDRYVVFGGLNFTIDPNTFARTPIPLGGPHASDLLAAGHGHLCAFYDPDLDRYVVKTNQPGTIARFNIVDPDTWQVTRLEPTGRAPDEGSGVVAAPQNNLYGKLAYSQELGGIVYGHPSHIAAHCNIWFVRTRK